MDSGMALMGSTMIDVFCGLRLRIGVGGHIFLHICAFVNSRQTNWLPVLNSRPKFQPMHNTSMASVRPSLLFGLLTLLSHNHHVC